MTREQRLRREAVAEALDKLIVAGSLMANLCHNLCQPSWTFAERHRDEMRTLYKQWDGLKAAYWRANE